MTTTTTQYVPLPGWTVGEATPQHYSGAPRPAVYDAPIPPCPECGGCMVHYGSRQLLVHDIPAEGRTTLLALDRRRYWCPECLRGVAQPIPDVIRVRRRTCLTRRLAAYVVARAATTDLDSLIRETGLWPEDMRAIIRRHAAAGEAVR